MQIIEDSPNILSAFISKDIKLVLEQSRKLRDAFGYSTANTVPFTFPLSKYFGNQNVVGTVIQAIMTFFSFKTPIVWIHCRLKKDTLIVNC